MESLYTARMEKALCLEDYREAALNLDRLQSHASWKLDPRSPWYDSDLLTKRYLNLLQVARSSNEGEWMHFLRTGPIRSFGGYADGKLLRVCHWGTKDLIEKYVAETVNLIKRLVPENTQSLSTTKIPMQVKHDFLVEMLQSYGRTALILHGGASFGASHLGVCKALHSQGLLPRIFCGSYIGALVASLICVTEDSQLDSVLAGKGLDLADITRSTEGNGSSLRRKLVRFLKYGHIFDIHVLEAWTRRVLGDLTFREAYTKSGGRILNIPVWSKRRSEVPVLLNWMTAPDVLVWSAACAACALPGLYEEVVLMVKDPRSGMAVPWNPSAIRLESAKVVNEVPLSRLTELFNANHFIVSHVPSFWSAGPRTSHPTPGQSILSRVLRFISSEASHRISQLASIGLLPTSIERLARFVRPPALGDIQIVPRILFSDLGLLVNNPTPEFLQYCLVKGERAGWRRISAVWVRCAIEFEIDKALQRARAQLE